MKVLRVTFPDESVREVPAITKVRLSTERPPGPVQLELVPVVDPFWEFYQVIGGWRARRR